VLLSVCTSNTPPPPAEVLATDQTLSFPIAQDVADLDPAQMSSPTDVDIFRNVFSGLYKFDAALHEVPDIATGPADLSADGLTYTFHLRHGATFSNGDPITADDFIAPPRSKAIPPACSRWSPDTARLEAAALEL